MGFVLASLLQLAPLPSFTTLLSRTWASFSLHSQLCSHRLRCPNCLETLRRNVASGSSRHNSYFVDSLYLLIPAQTEYIYVCKRFITFRFPVTAGVPHGYFRTPVFLLNHEISYERGTDLSWNQHISEIPDNTSQALGFHSHTSPWPKLIISFTNVMFLI